MYTHTYSLNWKWRARQKENSNPLGLFLPIAQDLTFVVYTLWFLDFVSSNSPSDNVRCVLLSFSFYKWGKQCHRNSLNFTTEGEEVKARSGLKLGFRPLPLQSGSLESPLLE